MKTLVINDTHLGVRRSAGTTMKSRQDLEDWMLAGFAQLLAIPHDRLIIAGDLFDTRVVSEHIKLEVMRMLAKEDYIIMLGNHDLGGVNDSVTLSSAEFIAAAQGRPVVREATMADELYLVPHLFNQQLHEEAVARCPDNALMICHCNIDNSLAKGDHSLNLSFDEIESLKQRGVKILATHEHHPRKFGPVQIIGNPFPSSIADCLGAGDKRCAIIEDGEISFVPTWSRSDYQEMDWQDLHDTTAMFIRVTGECQVSETPAVVRAISDYRKKSSAFIVGSAVKTLTVTRELGEVEVDQFNILDLVLQQVPEEFRSEVKSCIS